MSRRKILPVLALAAAATSASIASAEIYKWVDENGVVHYADQPQHRNAERSEIDSRRTDDSAARERLQASLAQSAAQRERFRENREPAEPDLVEQAKRTVELRRQSCVAAREKLTQFTQARRLYTLDEDGAKVYLNEEETNQARADVEAAVKEHCD